MNKVLFLLLFYIPIIALAQQSAPLPPVEICVSKTVNIVFPCSIRRVDLGSQDIASQVVDIADTILQIKAVREHFPETNMSVLTEDGILRVFTVRFAEAPQILLLTIGKDSTTSQPHITSPFWLRKAAEIALEQKTYSHRSNANEQIRYTLSGVYFQQDIIWLVFRIKNISNLPFSGNVRFYQRTKEKGKRQVNQQLEIVPLWNTQVLRVESGKTERFAICFRPFRVAAQNKFICQLVDENGISLDLTLSQKAFLRARPILP